MTMNLFHFNGAQRFLAIFAILSTAFTKPPILCMTKPFGFRTNGHGSVSPSSVSNLPHDSMPTMELTMKKIVEGATFGDQGHVLTAPRMPSCHSSSACHLFCKEAPVGGVAQKKTKNKKNKQTMIMKRINDGATFGDQGHVLTAPRMLSCHSTSAYHFYRTVAPEGKVAQFFAELLLLILLVRVGRAFFLNALRSIRNVDCWRNAVTDFLKAFAFEKIAVSSLLSGIKFLWETHTIILLIPSFQEASRSMTTNFLDFIVEKIALYYLMEGVEFLCRKLTIFHIPSVQEAASGRIAESFKEFVLEKIVLALLLSRIEFPWQTLPSSDESNVDATRFVAEALIDFVLEKILLFLLLGGVAFLCRSPKELDGPHTSAQTTRMLPSPSTPASPATPPAAAPTTLPSPPSPVPSTPPSLSPYQPGDDCRIRLDDHGGRRYPYQKSGTRKAVVFDNSIWDSDVGARVSTGRRVRFAAFELGPSIPIPTDSKSAASRICRDPRHSNMAHLPIVERYLVNGHLMAEFLGRVENIDETLADQATMILFSDNGGLALEPVTCSFVVLRSLLDWDDGLLQILLSDDDASELEPDDGSNSPDDESQPGEDCRRVPSPTYPPTPTPSSTPSTPVSPPPPPPPPPKIKQVSPAGDWILDPRLGRARRRSARITSTQPSRRSSRLAALPQINYRL
jgi:hypothetical protein